MKTFEGYLIDRGLSANTRTAYLYASKQFDEMFDEVNDPNLDAYRTYLQDNFSAKTINMRINGMNAYLDYLGETDKRLRSVKIQQKPFLENVISKDEYKRFVNSLKSLEDRRWYFAVRMMTCTGARVSELLKLNVSDVMADHLDIVSKGNKLRRIYIPNQLKEECLSWLRMEGISSGAVFRNQSGNRITCRGLSGRLKTLAKEYEINPDVVYPHSFRHRFAKNFLEKSSDIAFLADLMGHESIETTRIYLRKTSAEQREAVDAIVDW